MSAEINISCAGGVGGTYANPSFVGIGGLSPLILVESKSSFLSNLVTLRNSIPVCNLVTLLS